MSSCETFRHESLWHGTAGFSAGIASVYTAPEYRGKGYARELLTQVIQAESASRQAFYLFSDIGASYYESLGFHASGEAYDRVFEGQGGDPFSEAEPCTDLPTWSERPFQLVVSPGSLDWQVERERVYSELQGRARPSVSGAKVGNSILLWSVNYKKQELFALLFYAEGSQEARTLLQAARRMTQSLGLKLFRAWEDGSSIAWPEEQSQRELRDGSLPMLRPASSTVSATEWQYVPRATWI